ncbi:MAG: hypothetical protein EAZ97_01080 [Bacteroidetes bacterium]|nr:MAG: hypothetical protein EAZ97_01080 [Bacteroidota bacterium]
MKKLKEIAKKHNFSEELVERIWENLLQTQGNQVQFNEPELGAMGQWQNGMVMISDMFNLRLKNKVNDLCTELSVLAKEQLTNDAKKPKSKDESEKADCIASQNGTEYAYFSKTNRLRMRKDDKTTFYDTTGYKITGISQAQQNGKEKVEIWAGKQKLSLEDFEKVKK